jgi:hypothetical protein
LENCAAYSLAFCISGPFSKSFSMRLPPRYLHRRPERGECPAADCAGRVFHHGKQGTIEFLISRENTLLPIEGRISLLFHPDQVNSPPQTQQRPGAGSIGQGGDPCFGDGILSPYRWLKPRASLWLLHGRQGSLWKRIAARAQALPVGPPARL